MRAVAIVLALVALPVLAFIGRLIWRAWHLAIVFALLAGAAHAQHVGPLYALAGDVLVMPPAPVEDPGRVVAQAAPQPGAPTVATVPVEPPASPVAPPSVNGAPGVATDHLAGADKMVPPVALNPLAPLVPPACVPSGKPFPVWLTVTLAIVGAAVSTLEALHSTGVVGK